MGFDDQDVVLTLPASPEFGDVARQAVGELARRRGFTRDEWQDLEAAVVHTLRLLEQADNERVRFTFGFTTEEIVVEAELATPPDQPVLAAVAEDRLRSTISDLVDEIRIDHEQGRVRFRKLRS